MGAEPPGAALEPATRVYTRLAAPCIVTLSQAEVRTSADTWNNLAALGTGSFDAWQTVEEGRRARELPE